MMAAGQGQLGSDNLNPSEAVLCELLRHPGSIHVGQGILLDALLWEQWDMIQNFHRSWITPVGCHDCGILFILHLPNRGSRHRLLHYWWVMNIPCHWLPDSWICGGSHLYQVDLLEKILVPAIVTHPLCKTVVAHLQKPLCLKWHPWSYPLLPHSHQVQGYITTI